MESGASCSTCPNSYSMQRVVLQSASKFQPFFAADWEEGRTQPTGGGHS